MQTLGRKEKEGEDHLLKNKHHFKETNILCFKNCETICREITTTYQDTVNILAAFRPPSSDKNLHLRELKQVFQLISTTSNYSYCGDINLDIFDTKIVLLLVKIVKLLLKNVCTLN